MSRIRSSQAFLVLIILGATAILSLLLYLTRPSAGRTEPEVKATLVDVIQVEKTDEPVLITAYGTVQANRDITLKAEVSGRIVKQSPNLVVGGLVKKNEVLIKLDPRDYLILIEQEKAALENAKFELEVEKGRQVIAKREWEQLSPSIKSPELSGDLALRKPHLREKEAALEAAKSRLEKAQLDYKRTIVRSPMDAIVIDESVEPGDYITPQTDITTLVATDTFRVQVSIPTNKLKWIDIPNSKVTVVQELGGGETVEWKAKILRLLGNLDPSGRMARLLVAVEDPLGLHHPQHKKYPLLIGSYVRVDFEGSTLTDVFKIPREALREDHKIWVKTKENTLDIIDVDIIFRHADFVYIRNGLEDKEAIVVSSIPIAIKGMRLQEANP